MVLQNKPIGIFDSGLGGLTVVRAISKKLPKERIVYFGDTARVPYGSKSKETVTRFSFENTDFLLRHGAKIIVVACNTSSSLSLDALKRELDIPVIGVISAGAGKALKLTKNNRIGVIGTRATVASRAYEKEIKRHNRKCACFTQSCPLFVPLVEEGWIDSKITRMVTEVYLAPLIKKNIDTLILGCTHYPLLKSVIKKVVGKKVRLVDSAEEVAEEVKGLLERKKLLRIDGRAKHEFFVSDEPTNFKAIGERFFGKKSVLLKKVSLRKY